jgi:nicotinate phosphoribosyltransferase
MTGKSSALLTDLYQLTMGQAYFEHGMHDAAVFEFCVRKFPPYRNFLVAAGLEQVVNFLQHLQFTPSELKWLEETGRFESKFIYALRQFRFTGDVDAMPEGTLFFPNEPILRVRAPLPEAQLVETRIINLLQLQTMIASKAARCVLTAPGKALIEFGLRRAHGEEAGLLGARAAYIAGFAGTSNVLAGQEFGIPLSGTMAHSFIQACDNEEEAFLRFARANRDVVLLIDTYDTEVGAHKVTQIAPHLKAEGIEIGGVRLDSGDLVEHSWKVRRILDAAGLGGVKIFASGNIDEYELHKFEEADAPIDGFGIGTKLSTTADCPYLECVYKLHEYAGRPRIKRSEGKQTLAGPKQVFRTYNSDGRMQQDFIALENETLTGEPLLQPVMRKGAPLHKPPALADIRSHVQRQFELLPEPLRMLSEAEPYSVTVSDALRKLSTMCDS